MPSPHARLQLQRRPAVLPEPVLRTAVSEMPRLARHRHGRHGDEPSRQGEFISIADKAEADLRTLLAIPRDYEVLFLQGGAIGENAIVPMNLLGGGSDIVDSSIPARGPSARSRKPESTVASTSRRRRKRKASRGFRTARRGGSRPARRTCTSGTNETIGGVEYHWTPDVGGDVPLVADMSVAHTRRVRSTSRSTA